MSKNKLFIYSSHFSSISSIRMLHAERNLLSRIFQPVQEIPWDKKSPKKFEEITSKSQRMLVDFGFIRPMGPKGGEFFT